MSNEFQILSDTSVDLTSGKYVLVAYIGATEKYWTGSAWTTDFSLAHQYNTSVITRLGRNTFAGSLNGADPSDADDSTITATFWDSSTTVALGTEQARANYSNAAQSVSAILDLLNSSRITRSSPIDDDQRLTLVYGADYLDADGLALTWSEDWTNKPDLSGSSIKFAIMTRADYWSPTTTSTSIGTGSYTMDGTTAVFKVELASDETNLAPLLMQWDYKYALWANLAGGSNIPIAIADATVQNGILSAAS